MYIETSSNNHGNNVFVSFERTDIIQITKITFYSNRFSILTNDSLKAMWKLRYYLKTTLGIQYILYPKIANIVVLQQNGHC